VVNSTDFALLKINFGVAGCGPDLNPVEVPASTEVNNTQLRGRK